MRIIFSFLVIMSLIISCKDDQPTSLFAIPFPDLIFEIPPTISPFAVHYFNIIDVPTNYINLANENGVSDSDVLRVDPSIGLLKSTNTNSDLSFIEQLSVRICPNDDMSENCGTEIFFRQPVAENTGNIIEIVPSDVNIKNTIRNEKVNIQVKIERLRYNPPQFVSVELELDFLAR